MFTKTIKIHDLECQVEGNTLEEVCEDIRASFYVANKYEYDKTKMAKAYPRIAPVYETAVMINGIFKAPVVASPMIPEAEEIIESVRKEYEASGKKK